MSRRRRAENAVAAELTHYFLTADTDQGMQSSWSAFVGIALGGFGGSPEQERRITDRRYRQHDERGYRVDNVISKAREVRNALLALPRRPPGTPSWYDVLYVAHGSIPWRQIIDQGFLKPTGKNAERFLPSPFLGVALLTDIVRKGWEAERAKRSEPINPGVLVTTRNPMLDEDAADTTVPFFAGRTVSAFRRGRVERMRRKNHAAWDTAGGWLVELVQAAALDEPTKEKLSRAEKKRRVAVSEAAKAKLGLVKGQAIAMLAEAERVYRSVRGALPAEEAEKLRAAVQAAAEEAATEPLAPRFASRMG